MTLLLLKFAATAIAIASSVGYVAAWRFAAKVGWTGADNVFAAVLGILVSLLWGMVGFGWVALS